MTDETVYKPNPATTFFVTETVFWASVMDGIYLGEDDILATKDNVALAQLKTVQFADGHGFVDGPKLTLVFKQGSLGIHALMSIAGAWQIAIEKDDDKEDHFRKGFWAADEYFGDRGRAALVWLLSACPDFGKLVHQVVELRRASDPTAYAMGPQMAQDGPAAPPASDRAAAPLACLCAALDDMAGDPVVRHRPGCRHYVGGTPQYPTVADFCAAADKDQRPEVAE